MATTRKQIAACPIHAKVKDAIIAELNHRNYFSKERILESESLKAIADSIHWAFLMELVEEDVGYRLTPLTKAFFTAERKETIKVNPNRAIATGHGKRCFGYASADFADGILERRRIEWQRNMAVGKMDQTNDQVIKLDSLGKISLPEMKALQIK